jgi:hypothetical protein
MAVVPIPKSLALDCVPAIGGHSSALLELCRRFHIQRLELFGSAVSGGFDPTGSDLDFLVEFAPLPDGLYASAFLDFKLALESLLDRPVDLVVASAIRNPYFRQSIERSKALLYAA